MPDTEIEGLKNPTGKDVLYSTYANIGKTRYASVNGYVNWNATPRTRIYMNMSGNYSYLEGSEGMRNDGLSVNKSFLDKRLTLSAFASNFFKKYMDQSSTTEGSGFIRESNYKYSRQRFGISVSYRIGELKASVKKAARTISNDDVKSGGSGSGGGGE